MKLPVISAQATVITVSGIEESRGSHQRSDFSELNILDECNYYVKLNKKTLDLDVKKKKISPFKETYQEIIDKRKKLAI